MDLTPEQPFSDTLLSPQDPPPPATTAHRIFFGRFGMRAGWGMAIFIVVLAVLMALGGFCALSVTGQLHQAMAMHAFAKAHPDAPQPPLQILAVPGLVDTQDGINFFGLLLACWIFSRAERRPLRSFGIGSYRWTDVFAGAFWGLAAMSGLVAALTTMHVLVFEGRALHGANIPLFGAKWLLAFFLVGLSEEYSFRGYLQFTLMRGVWGLAERLSPTRTRAVAFWLAATLLSALFTLAHTGNQGETLIGLLQVFLAGMTLAYALWRTGSLWWSIGMHMTWDWAQSFLFGVADSGNVSVGRLFATHPAGNPILSGGLDGPEGSLIGVIALALVCVAIRFTTRPGIQPAIEQDPPSKWEFNADQRPVL